MEKRKSTAATLITAVVLQENEGPRPFSFHQLKSALLVD